MLVKVNIDKQLKNLILFFYIDKPKKKISKEFR